MSPTQSHSQDTVRQLYREHHGWLVRLLRRKLGEMEHAADLAHDTFERILRADLGPVVAAPRAYLTTVAQRLAISHFRRAAVQRAFLEALAARPEATAPSPEQQLQFQQSLLAILEVLDGLSLRTRRIFLLAQFDGALGIVDHRADFAPMAHDPRVVKQALDIRFGKMRDLVKLEIGESSSKVFSLSQDGQPGKTGLKPLKADLLEQAAIINDGAAPFIVVISHIIRQIGMPETAQTAVGAFKQAGGGFAHLRSL